MVFNWITSYFRKKAVAEMRKNAITDEMRALALQTRRNNAEIRHLQQTLEKEKLTKRINQFLSGGSIEDKILEFVFSRLTSGQALLPQITNKNTPAQNVTLTDVQIETFIKNNPSVLDDVDKRKLTDDEIVYEIGVLLPQYDDNTRIRMKDIIRKLQKERNDGEFQNN